MVSLLPASPLPAYAKAFEARSQPFLHHYSVGKDKSLVCASYTRGEFWDLATRASRVLRAHGVGAGDHVTHWFTENSQYDLAFRLAAVMLGSVPVTVNWSADTVGRVQYKVELTKSKLILVDGGGKAEWIRTLVENTGVSVFDAARVASWDEPGATAAGSFSADDLGEENTRIVIFTSGTTGNPKGVRLTYSNYRVNRLTFEQFLGIDDADHLVAFVTNPMHHTNSTAITDWSLRRPGTVLHLLARYTTKYWARLLEVAGEATAADKASASVTASEGGAGRTRVVAPLVSKHFDILDSMAKQGKLPVPIDELRLSLQRVHLMLGSAPVGPTTVERLQHYTGGLPVVRFGSTETCLQVMGTPPTLPAAQRLGAFQAGWGNQWRGEAQKGFWIGRPHPPYTEAKVVRSTDRTDTDKYMVDTDECEPGYLVCRGGNIMAGYVQNVEATAKAIHPGGWYTNLGDIVFWKKDAADGAKNFYWSSRDNALLIKGGTNYAYDQINGELTKFLEEKFVSLSVPQDFSLAVCGLMIGSEHEDSCYVTVELISAASQAVKADIEHALMDEAKKAEGISKGAMPDYIMFAAVPRNFKGAIQVPQLRKQCEQDAVDRDLLPDPAGQQDAKKLKTLAVVEESKD